MNISLSGYSFHDETASLDDYARGNMPGQFISLSRGVTHYELSGNPEGQPVVLIHGFSIPYYLWDRTFPILVQNGFRVLRYDLFGRGYSDRPALAYSIDLFDQQLDELIAALHLAKPVDLVCSSMGGVIAAAYADRHPETVRRLVFIDPAGFIPGLSFPKSLLRIPLLGEWLMDWLGTDLLISGNRDDFFHTDAFPEYIDQFKPQLRYRGYRQAILSTMRTGIISKQEALFHRVGAQSRPTLLIWGKEDQVIPFSISEKVRSALPHAEFWPIDQAGHVPHYELPEVVNPILLRFLGKAG